MSEVAGMSAIVNRTKKDTGKEILLLPAAVQNVMHPLISCAALANLGAALLGSILSSGYWPVLDLYLTKVPPCTCATLSSASIWQPDRRLFFLPQEPVGDFGVERTFCAHLSSDMKGCRRGCRPENQEILGHGTAAVRLPQGSGAAWGAGDWLMSFLGVVILSFGFKIFGQRRLMQRHAPEIFGATLLSAAFSLFATAFAAHAIGLEPGAP